MTGSIISKIFNIHLHDEMKNMGKKFRKRNDE